MSWKNYYGEPKMQNAWEFMGEPRDRCFYIPAYQRPFAWVDKPIKRFFEGIVEDIGEMFKDKKRDVSFVGTVVCFDDRQHETVHPSVVNELPDVVYNIIDGQQRFTVILTACVLLHDYIRNKREKVKSEWLQEKSVDMLDKLGSMIEIQKAVGEHPHYPKMIRAFEDTWSKREARVYASPLSYFIRSYGDFCRSQNDQKVSSFRYDGGDAAENLTVAQQNNHVVYNKAVKCVKKIILGICGGKMERFPDIGKAIRDEKFLSEIFHTKELPEEAFSNEDAAQCELARAILFASYLINNVHFVVLLTSDEDYAFDMFESLNATGDPLTAYETFKPEVIRAEKLAEYENTPSKVHIDTVDECLSSNREQASDMLVWFALAETGETLSKKMPSQRRFMREQYHRKNITDKRNFTRHLMHTALTYRHLWNGEDNLNMFSGSPFSNLAPATTELVKDANFCLYFLNDAGNKIALAPLTRFYEQVCLASSAQREERVIEFCKATRAIASFYALWRSSRATTDGIDERYRTLMTGSEEKGIDALCRIAGQAPSYAKLRKALLHFLRKDGGNSYYVINSCAEWSARCANTQMYSVRSVCKFLLMVSAHRTRLQDGGSGLLEGVAPNAGSTLINWQTWPSDDYKTVEHIVPQSSGRDPDEIHRFGNLTLVPCDVNSILGKHEWQKKKIMYEILSAETADEREVALKKGQSANLPENSIEKLSAVLRCLPMTKALAMMNADAFELEQIKKREENLLSLAWRILAEEWLEWNKS